MILGFYLSMPHRNSWNGGWSGNGKKYAIVKSIASENKAEKILANGPYYHFWKDGWTACVNVKKLDGGESRKERKASMGFCGYDWMVKNILIYGNTEGIEEGGNNADKKPK